MDRSALTLLLEAFQNLVDFIDARAVRQGSAHVLGVSTLQELERRARSVVDAIGATGLRPNPEGQRQSSGALCQAYQQAVTLQTGANEGLCCCIDLRLVTAPPDLRALFDRAAHEATRGMAVSELVAPKNPGEGRKPAAKLRRPRPGSAKPPGPGRVPKHIEMMGKARKLCDLICGELADDSGRSITQMCQMVGISRETFGNSKHFQEARAAWARLRQVRDSHRSPAVGT
jgi:hypothetical protein